MKTFFKWLLAVPVAIVLGLFALFNRQSVPVVLDPFGTDIGGLRFEAPLFFVMLVCLALGLIVGGFIVWLGQGKHRRAARAARAETLRVAAENESLRAHVAAVLPALAPPVRNAA